MAISRISSAAAQTTSVSITTPSFGDLIVVMAHRDGSTTAPTLPTGYLTLVTGSSNTNSERVGWKYSDGTETTSGTWTNATSVAVGVYRGVDPQVPFGVPLDNGGASTSVTTSTLTMQYANSTSWVLAFGAHRTATNLNQTLSGLTLVTSATDINISDSNAAVNSYTGGGLTVNANSGWRTATVELVAKQSPSPIAQLVQQVSTGSNDNAENGNAFGINFPNLTGSGNCLVICVTSDYNAARTCAITDDVTGQTYTLRQHWNDNLSFLEHRIYTCHNIPAGIRRITATFDTTLGHFQMVITELSGIDTSSPYDTGSANSRVTIPQLKPGSMTTGSSGDLIYTYVLDDSGDWGTNGIVGFRADGGARMISGQKHLGVAVMMQIQAAAGAINPAMSIIGPNAGEEFAIGSIALKTSAGAGTPLTGCKIVTVQHMNAYAGDYQICAPTNGNLQVLMTAYSKSSMTINSAKQANGTVGTLVQPLTTVSQGIYFANLADDGCNRIVTNTTDGGGGGMNLIMFDIKGADVAPYDKEGHGNWDTTNAGDPIVDQPAITPARGGGVITCTCAFFTGPPDAITSPATAVFDSGYYTGYTDLSPFDLGDGYGHVYPTDTSALSITWRDTQTSGGYSLAISFLPLVLPTTPVVVMQAVQRAAVR